MVHTGESKVTHGLVGLMLALIVAINPSCQYGARYNYDVNKDGFPEVVKVSKNGDMLKVDVEFYNRSGNVGFTQSNLLPQPPGFTGVDHIRVKKDTLNVSYDTDNGKVKSAKYIISSDGSVQKIRL